MQAVLKGKSRLIGATVLTSVWFSAGLVACSEQVVELLIWLIGNAAIASFDDVTVRIHTGDIIANRNPRANCCTEQCEHGPALHSVLPGDEYALRS